MAADLKKLQDLIGYHFKDVHWLERAMTHSSTNEDYNYQRLEFLGDRVLGLVIAGALFTEFKHEPEGSLAKRHTALIQGQTCAVVGLKHGLNKYIIMSQAEEEAGGRINENIIGDIVESMLGAIYIDGGYEVAQKIILTLWGDTITTLEKAPQDSKTELQEWVQARMLDLPLYEVVDKEGPDHAPIFKVQITVTGFEPIYAKGNSRRQAEKLVAKKMLQIVKGL